MRDAVGVDGVALGRDADWLKGAGRRVGKEGAFPLLSHSKKEGAFKKGM